MKAYLFLYSVLIAFLCCFQIAEAQEKRITSEKKATDSLSTSGMLDNPEDPQNQLELIRERGGEKDALIRTSSSAEGFRERAMKWKNKLHEKSGLNLGWAWNHQFQWLTSVVPGEEVWGTASDMDFMATWEVLNRGKPSQGQIFAHIEGRWSYGTTGPMDLGAPSLGSLMFTSNTYAAYVPIFLPFRNFYWQQGGKEAGWVYRIGKITTDQLFGSSKHISPVATFNTIGGTGAFSIGLPDSGLGLAGIWYFKESIGLQVVISDANANRQNIGDIGAGDFYKGLELGVKLFPRTSKAGYSKFALWHNDGSKDGQPINAMLGPSGWGYFIKLEHELTSDGRSIGIARYGKSHNGSALYGQQAGLHWILNDPHFFGHIRNDAMGLAVNWVQPNISNTRDEYNFEVFYRFPLISHLDVTLNYLLLMKPSLDLGTDYASAFGLRVRTTF